MLPKASGVRALLWLCLCLDLTAAVRFVARADEGPATITTSAEMPKLKPSTTTTDGGNVESNSTTVGPSSSTSSVTITSSTSLVTSVTAVPTSINSTSNPLDSLFNSTIPAGELPIIPSLTPAYAVAGVILLGTGVGYSFVGIKSQWVQSFMAAAYLAAVGTSILILYVMTPPISNAVQGAYLVAVVCTGLVLGGASLIFKEITECLGCILGGFCLSMWLLTLKSGGLVPGTGAKVGFILAFTLAAFATYFSRWTRHYALMACISFSGATAAVLGIDCFSRAGLKEFWAYIWALNDHLFPLGADTYPLTKGIKVELAATILIFIAGMMSQLKLWRVIQKKRDQRERQRAEGRRAVETEDLNIGQQVETMTHRERRQWERVYGDGAEKGYADSGVGDMGSTTKLRSSTTMVAGSRMMSPAPNDDQFQMVEIPLDDGVPSRRRTVLFQETRPGRDSMRLSRQSLPARQPSGSSDGVVDVPKVWVIGADGEARLEEDTKQTSKAFSSQPDIVPLPFTVPTGDEDDVQDNRSSVAAFMDDDGEVRSLPDSRRNSLAKRLSVGSGEILRRLSQRSKRTVASYEDAGESREDLVLTRQSRRYDDNDSLAATLDDLSSDGRESDTEGSRRWSEVERPQSQVDTDKRKSEEKSTQLWLSPSRSKLGTAETALIRPDSPVEGQDDDTAEAQSQKPTEANQPGLGPMLVDALASIKGTKTVAPAAGPEVLKPEHLPRPLSRVALSYRTNEWAKHLSHAETPDPDNDNQSKQHFIGIEEPIVEEPAPLDVEELQKTADNASRPAAAPRSASAMSSYSALPQPISRTSSRVSLLQSDSRNISPIGQSFPPQVHKNLKRGTNNRRTSAQLLAEPIAEEGDGEATVSRSPTIPEEGSSTSPSPTPLEPSFSVSNLSLSRPPVPGIVSYSSPQTLIGQREMLLRNKSQASFYSPTPEPGGAGMLSTIQSRASSDAGSIYGGAQPSLGISTSPRTSLENNADLDDLPLSQRRQILRQSSLDLQPQPYLHNPASAAADFDSHQPIHRRASGNYVPTEAARQAQLASFRNSVQTDLRHGNAFAGSPYGASGNTSRNASATKVYGAGVAGWDADVRRSVEQQRSYLMGQKEAEAQRREMERMDKERSEREFEERMRRGELLGAHRDAMRRLQGGVKDL